MKGWKRWLPGLQMLKRYEDAMRDGDRVYAVIKGIGSAVGGGVDAKPSANALPRAAEQPAT